MIGRLYLDLYARDEKKSGAWMGTCRSRGLTPEGLQLPSKLFENWCWEREGLDLISSHIETGEPLPDTLLNKMVAARNFRSAGGLLGSVRFGLFDYRLHCLTDPPGSEDILALMEEIRGRDPRVEPMLCHYELIDA